MPATAQQLYEATELVYNDGNVQRATVHYIVRGAATELVAVQTVAAAAAASFENVPMADISVTEHLDAESWKVNVEYTSNGASFSSDGLPNETVSWSSSPSTIHITHSKATRYYGKAVGVYHAIDVQGDSSNRTINGTDVYIPCPTMRITHCFTRAQFSDSRRDKIVYEHACKTNNATFRGYAAGTLLYLGADVTQIGEGISRYYQVDYSFMLSPNASSMTIPGTQITVRKDGWEYLWLRNKTTKNVESISGTNTYIMAPQPIGAYVERVYDACDFTELGLSAS